jgi:TonB family protein
LHWLGGSQQGGVYLTEIDDGQKAAIKLVAADAPDAETRLAGWTAAKNLSHPHLIHVLHTGRCALDDNEEEVVYAVTEFADEVLAEILLERALTPEETGEMLGPVLDALAYLHGRGFAHGQLKPSNILVVEDQLKLSADCIHVAESSVRPLSKLGAYDAPELGDSAVSPASDIWSLGMTLVAALTQQTPAWESAAGAPAVSASIPEPFAGIVRACLHPDPAQRCALSEVKTRLHPEKLPLTTPSITPQIEPEEELVPQVRSFGQPAILVAAAIVLVGIAVAVVTHSLQTHPRSSVPTDSPAPAASTTTPSPSETPPAPAQVPAATPAPLAKPHASAAAQDTTKGVVANRVLPDVPAQARATIRGKVVVKVRVEVDAKGDVSDASSESPNASPYFRKWAIEAARAWKFTPPQNHGTPASSTWTLDFVFRPHGIEATALEANR